MEKNKLEMTLDEFRSKLSDDQETRDEQVLELYRCFTDAMRNFNEAEESREDNVNANSDFNGGAIWQGFNNIVNPKSLALIKQLLNVEDEIDLMELIIWESCFVSVILSKDKCLVLPKKEDYYGCYESAYSINHLKIKDIVDLIASIEE